MEIKTFTEILDKIKSSGLLIITILGVGIITFALMVNFYPQVVFILLDDNNPSLKIAIVIGWGILSLFFGAVVYYVMESLAQKLNARKSRITSQREKKKFFRDLPPSHKAILRRFIDINRPFDDFNTYNSLIYSVVSDLERQNILHQGNDIGSNTYHIHLELFTFLKENSELLND